MRLFAFLMSIAQLKIVICIKSSDENLLQSTKEVALSEVKTYFSICYFFTNVRILEFRINWVFTYHSST